MTIRSYNPYDRYRQRSLERMMGILVVIAAMGIAAGIGFWLGRQTDAQKTHYLQQKVNEAQAMRDQMETEMTELRAEAQTATMRLQQLQKTYEETIPAGPMQDLIALIRKQLDEGMDPQRLAFLVRSARPPRNCTEPETRRFVIATPANTGPASSIDIKEGGIVIKGSGISARNEKGAPEAWYDASKSVSLEFTIDNPLTAEEPVVEKKAGVMPLHHSTVSGNREYRFTIAEGARSFAKVTFDSCDYP
jgi:hypothetical protein